MNFMYYILIAVIVLVVAIDLYQKKKNEKSDSTDVDKFNDNSFSKEPKKFNPLLLIGGSLIFFTIAFFLIDKFVYNGRLSDNNDGITLIQNLTYEKFNISELENDYDAYNEDGPQTTYTLNNKKITGILIDEFGNYEGAVINGFPESMHRTFFENGQLVNESEYKNGRRNGFFKVWYENGNTKQESILKNGLNHGPIKKFHLNGQIKEEFTYQALRFIHSHLPNSLIMDKVGLHKEWYENGQLKRESTSQFNPNSNFSEYNGTFKKFYANGSPEVDQIYINGKLDGISSAYYSNGNIKETGIHNNGIKKNYRWYNIDGIKFQEVLFNDDGIGFAIKMYDSESGELELRKVMNDGIHWLDEKGEINKNEFDYFVWYKNGERIQKQNFRNGKEYGKRIFY